MRRECSEEEFLKDVSTHQLEIVKEDGVYRHLRFRRPGTYCMGFDIITYPGYLCYSGDMGCFVFTRVHDMLTFFRGKSEGPIEINPRYWSEKLQAVDPHSGFEAYSADRFREWIADELNQFKEQMDDDRDYDSDDEEHAAKIEKKFDALKTFVESEILSKADDGEYPVYEALRDFEHDGRHWFVDSWEVSFREYTHRFLWCCFALVWSIRQYDSAKATSNEEQATG